MSVLATLILNASQHFVNQNLKNVNHPVFNNIPKAMIGQTAIVRITQNASL